NYDGTPIVLMHSTDVAVLTNLAPVAKNLMEKAGFKVDMQAMTGPALAARRATKDPPAQGGWPAFLTAWVAADILNPISSGFINASCDTAMFGWPCDKEMESLRDQYARESNPAELKSIAEAVLVRETQYPTHVWLGQWYQPVATRKSVDGVIAAPATVLGGIEKTGRCAPCASPAPERVGGARRPMLGYIARRLLATVPVMTVVAIFVFLLLRLTAGDPAAIIAGDSATTQQVAEIRQKLGLERPIVEQFFIWIGRILHGDFGESYFFKKTVVELIRDRLEPTAALAVCTLILAVAMAVPLGVVAAVRRGTWIDRAVMGFSVLGFSVPV